MSGLSRLETNRSKAMESVTSSVVDLLKPATMLRAVLSNASNQSN